MDPKPSSGPTSPIISPKHDETFNSCSSDRVSSPVSETTHEPTNNSQSLTQSPPAVQVMERHDDLDFSHRFSSSSSWSSDSNESLFSIHMTGSYKHDQARLPEHSGQSKSDEPQKVVRWKTQVEHVADEGVSSQDQQLESSPLKDHNEPKNKFCWSKCNCGSCNLPKCSCWNDCWKNMKCSNCKPKKGHSKEANAPKSDSPKKPVLKKMDLNKWCCCGSCLACFRSCTCHCCLGDISASA